MVYFFKSVSDPTAVLYMGKDKFENEFLIKYAQHHDIWFHVDKLSSAHVYLRTAEPIDTYSSLTPELINECAQLCKANSIEGCKKANVGINYTWATNLLKTDNMETGSVSFKNSKLVKLIHIDKDKEIVKTIIKTKEERFPEFEKDYREYLRELEREKNS